MDPVDDPDDDPSAATCSPEHAGLSVRQRRERAFYDAYSARHADEPISLDPIAGAERRPWNPYWRLFEIVKDHHRPDARLLDFGCGWGTNTVVFATIGYQVDAFDISEGNLAACRRNADKHGVGASVTTSIQAAEALTYPEASFDVVAGVDILHHVQLAEALRECRRVLRPGGIAVFREPVESAVFDALRNTRLARWMFPKDASLDKHITHDERKLGRGDLRVIAELFPDHAFERFRVLSRFDAVWRRATMTLEKIDRRLVRLPGGAGLAGTIVMTLRK